LLVFDVVQNHSHHRLEVGGVVLVAAEGCANSSGVIRDESQRAQCARMLAHGAMKRKSEGFNKLSMAKRPTGVLHIFCVSALLIVPNP
jgi:hypothetical protein